MKKLLNYCLVSALLILLGAESVDYFQYKENINHIKNIKSEKEARNILKNKSHQNILASKKSENILFKNILCLSGYPCEKNKNFYQKHIQYLLSQSPLKKVNHFYHSFFFSLSFVIFNLFNYLSTVLFSKSSNQVIILNSIDEQEEKPDKKAA